MLIVATKIANPAIMGFDNRYVYIYDLPCTSEKRERERERERGVEREGERERDFSRDVRISKRCDIKISS